MRGIARKFSADKILLGIFFIRRRNEAFFENGGAISAHTTVKCWEPGESPGRLRHCNGYKFQCHWSKDREGGMRFEAEVRIPV
jgi:hypothetical protein